MQGTKFQMMVWKEIAKIPQGMVLSYKELAHRVGNIQAYRAVANACGKNPQPIEIPCHRVVCSDGSLGGYSGAGGIAKKKSLLENEGHSFDNKDRIIYKK